MRLTRLVRRLQFTADMDRDLRDLQSVIHEHVMNVLAACRGNRSRAARILGIDRKTLYRQLRRAEAATSG
jgi:transcriptional regulator of acetoin/glycerol metabolism